MQWMMTCICMYCSGICMSVPNPPPPACRQRAGVVRVRRKLDYRYQLDIRKVDQPKFIFSFSLLWGWFYSLPRKGYSASVCGLPSVHVVRCYYNDVLQISYKIRVPSDVEVPPSPRYLTSQCLLFFFYLHLFCSGHFVSSEQGALVSSEVQHRR